MAKGFKTGGREQGTPNKITGEIRERINLVLGEYFEKETFEQDLKELDPEKRLSILVKLLDFAIPRMQSTKLEMGFPSDFSIDPIEWIGTKEWSGNKEG